MTKPLARYNPKRLRLTKFHKPKFVIPKPSIVMLPEIAPKAKRVVTKKIEGRRALIENRRRWRYEISAGVTDMLMIDVGSADVLVKGLLRPSNKEEKRPWMFSHPIGYLPTRTIIVDLNYPLCKTARVTIEPLVEKRKTKNGSYDLKSMSVGYVLWQLSQAYLTIYKSHKLWGVWGHGISDLHFERFELDDNIGRVDVGS